MPGAEAAFRVRDTDADWREVGQSQPYWGVLSHPDFLRENITPEAVDRFYDSGPIHIRPIAEELKKLTGEYPSGRALDFGCGVGRLAEAMLAFAREVTGLDISPGMLALARARGSKVTYTDRMPDGPFDWINSFIVFQHIPPERGEAILKQLLDRLADGGMVSLQLTIWRDDRHVWVKDDARGLERFLRSRRERSWVRSLPVGHIHMFDYDLSRVVRLLNLAGVEDMRLASTDHDGHHGVIIMGRKTAPKKSA
ncbi:MAG: class I SAM-dependent DNA methyltransferase [Phenylobacterium sp.]